MSTSHFDILVLGSSPAARMAAALCAEGGRKVLLLDSDPAPPQAPWCHPSLHLERLLETLGGRACLRPTPAIQVHAGTTRLTLHGRQTLEAELLRECRQQQPQMLKLLEGLQQQGQQLEEILWRCQGLPLTGWRSRLRFRWQLLRRGKSFGPLCRPLSTALKPLGATAGLTLETLFSGLALAPADKLTVAEAALLWHCASRIESLDWEPFTQLLEKRFEQFHGKTEPARDLKQIKRRNDRRFELSLKGHPAATASWVLLGDKRVAEKLPAEIWAPSPEEPLQQRYSALLRLGHPSSLLAPGILVDQPGGLRLSLPAEAGAPLGIEAGGGATGDTGQLLARLETVLPFTELALVPAATTTMANTSKTRRYPFPGAGGCINLAAGLLYCDGQGVLPHLGLPGEAILGTTVANLALSTPQDGSR